MKLSAIIGFVLFGFPVFLNAALQVDQPRNTDLKISVHRSAANPLITSSLSASIGNNINGPSVIKVPEWVKDPLGKYYLYFAHHRGKFIRMAYADRLEGPWSIYEPGVLHLKQVPVFKNHIASPDVHVDSVNRQIIIYYHGRRKAGNRQGTMMACSKDGLVFEPAGGVLGFGYFRVFKWGGYFYSIDDRGYLNRSRYPGKAWGRRAEKIVAPVTVNDRFGIRNNVRIRHSAVFLQNNILFLFYSRKADAPERILVSTIELNKDWNHWTASPPVEVIRPQTAYEGVFYPNKPSEGGAADNVHQLRDPFVFSENGNLYLFYTIAGESGIAMAEIKIEYEEKADIEIPEKADDQ